MIGLQIFATGVVLCGISFFLCTIGDEFESKPTIVVGNCVGAIGLSTLFTGVLMSIWL
jgi:hypothetical protein